MRMKQVFPTDEIPHLWAHQTQSEARNPQRNLYFRDSTIFSYRDSAPIGKFYTRGKRRIALVSSYTYSVTTSGHISAVRQAIPKDVPMIEVPHVLGSWNSEPNHDDNLRYLTDQSREALTKAGNARSNGTHYLNEAFSYRATAKAYAKWFKVKAPKFEFLPSGNKLAALKAKIAERESRARVKEDAKRERTRAQWKERERLAALELPEKIAAWRNGKDIHFGSLLLNSVPTMLRIVGTEVQTSRGARFPVEHACKGLILVEACVSSSREWQANGHTLHLGHYAIDRIEANGTVHAGCHIVPYAEIQAIAPKLREMCAKTKEAMPRTAHDEIV